ncbi:MAG: hypothetical protein H0V88_13835 [Pyrinomonadaceae bacterium]|nr:hypothetical protein [Pyrinomonadaceae bacterium]
MTYPSITRIELPILQELAATGGFEDVRFLYARLIAYFPQLQETHSLHNGDGKGWRRIVQRAGRALDTKREIERLRGHWHITNAGRKRVASESSSFTIERTATALETFTHTDIQNMLADIGRVLGYHAQLEFEYYDVIWRKSKTSPRLSHIFEVQRKGNIDAALAKLKQGYEAQRSKTFLVISNESDTNRARKAMTLGQRGAFHELDNVTTILSFEQLRKLHRHLTSVEDLLIQLFD